MFIQTLIAFYRFSFDFVAEVELTNLFIFFLNLISHQNRCAYFTHNLVINDTLTRLEFEVKMWPLSKIILSWATFSGSDSWLQFNHGLARFRLFFSHPFAQELKDVVSFTNIRLRPIWRYQGNEVDLSGNLLATSTLSFISRWIHVTIHYFMNKNYFLEFIRIIFWRVNCSIILILILSSNLYLVPQILPPHREG